MISAPEKKLDGKRSTQAAGCKPQSSTVVGEPINAGVEQQGTDEISNILNIGRLKIRPEYSPLYDGDSSDGEDQDNKEQEYSTEKNYISSIQENITKTSYKYEYVLKDIGGRLLHNQEVGSIYFGVKQSCKIHNAKLSELYKNINDKYIVVKHKAKPCKRLLIKDGAPQKVDCFLETISEDLKDAASAVQDALKKIISNLGIFAEDTSSDNASDFLAKVRVYHKCIRGITKQCLIKEDFPHEYLSGRKPKNMSVEVDMAIDKEILKIQEEHIFYHTGSRTVEVSGIEGYSSSVRGDYTSLKNKLKQKCKGSSLKSCFKSILRNEIPQDACGESLRVDNKHFFYGLAFLLFVCETTRNVGAFLTNAMFFDLVDKGIYLIDDLPAKLPMAPQGSTSASLYINHKIGPKYGKSEGGLSSVLHYDFREKVNNPQHSKKSVEELAVELNERSKNLFNDWVTFYKIKLSKDRINNIFKEHTQNLEKNAEVITKLKSLSLEKEVVQDKGTSVPVKFIYDLMNDWYGLDMSYLGEGAIDFGS